MGKNVAFFISFASLALLSVVYGSNSRVLLRDLSTITLYNGRMTNGRRSSPVKQLNCVGGSAKGAFNPQVIQCYNKGHDGVDVQWQCKTDMDNAYRFGTVEVTCEGYDYPEDPYVLAGSCGLEYTLDYTKEGNQQKQHHYGDDYHDRSSSHYDGSYTKSSSGISGLYMLGIAAFVIYVIYKTCLSNDTTGPRDTGTPPSAPPPYSQHDQNQGSQQPPPPGFKPEYGNQGSASPNQGCNGGFTSQQGQNTGTGFSGGTGGGGFWTGLGAGGMLGYLFGNTNRGTGYGSGYGTGYGYGSGYMRNRQNTGFGFGSGSGFGFGSGSSFGGSSSSSSGSTGTRTASGFGTTKRR